MLNSIRARHYFVLTSEETCLIVRQDPKQALTTPEHKEKLRKPVDPPPIVQLKVEGREPDAHSNWLVNPFLFMNATLVEATSEPRGDQTHYQPIPGNPVVGQNVSSLHRLKDVDNQDGGFFVFGDLSCRRTGTYRLQFNLFDYHKGNAPGEDEVVWVKSTVSAPFHVVTSKDFHGLAESTHLSRTFSDQGVRLRLRKEARTLGSKRTWENVPPETSTPPVHQGSYGGNSHDRYAYGAPGTKRQRSDSDYGNPQMYAPATMPHYSGNLQESSHGWSAQYQENLPSGDLAAIGSNMMSLNQPHSTNVPVWQGQVQRGPLSAPAGGTSGMSYFSGVGRDISAPRSYLNSKYAQHQNQQHHIRGTGDGYPTIGGLQTPISLPDSALSSHAQSNYPSQIAQQSHFHPTQRHEEVPSPAIQHDPRSVVIDSSGHPYHDSGQTTTNVGGYDQHPQSSTGQYAPGDFGPSQHLYPDPSRNAYPPNTGSLSNTNLPLDSGVLNRDFVDPFPGEQQTPYTGMTEQDLKGFGLQQPNSYPTPQQRSPMT